MQRISTLIQKLSELAEQEKKLGLIDIDLMLDYTRVMYADLLEVRKNYALNDIVSAGADKKENSNSIENPAITPADKVVQEKAAETIKETPASNNVEMSEAVSNIEEDVVAQEVQVEEETTVEMSEPAIEPDPEPIVTRVPHINYAAVPNIDIRTRIGINDKYLFISELFANDKVAYDDAIKQLNGFNSIDEAEKWVDAELVSKYGWDKEQETVQSFYDLLNQSFPAT